MEAYVAHTLRLFDGAAGPPTGSVGELVAAYLDQSQDRLAQQTLYVRALDLGSFADYIGRNTLLSDLLPSDAEKWLAQHPEWSRWTRHAKLKALKACLNWGVRERRVTENPFRFISQAAGLPRRAMTDSEFDTLCRHTDPCFRRLLVFLRETGARPGEASAITWDMLDTKRGCFTLLVHKTSRTARQPRPRRIYLTPKCLPILQELKVENGHGHVFLNVRGTPWNRCSLSLRMQRLRHKAGLGVELKLYGTRHAFGTRGVKAGVDLKTLAELMGSSYVIVERNYVHLEGQDAHLRNAAQVVAGGSVD